MSSIHLSKLPSSQANKECQTIDIFQRVEDIFFMVCDPKQFIFEQSWLRNVLLDKPHVYSMK